MATQERIQDVFDQWLERQVERSASQPGHPLYPVAQELGISSPPSALEGGVVKPLSKERFPKLTAAFPQRKLIDQERQKELMMGLAGVSKMRNFFGLDTTPSERGYRWFTKDEDKQIQYYLSQRKNQYLQMYPGMGPYQAAQAALGDARRNFPDIHPDALAASLGKPFPESTGGAPPETIPDKYYGVHVSAYAGAAMAPETARRLMTDRRFQEIMQTAREYKRQAIARGDFIAVDGLVQFAFDDLFSKDEKEVLEALRQSPARERNLYLQSPEKWAEDQIRKAAPYLSLAAARLGILGQPASYETR